MDLKIIARMACLTMCALLAANCSAAATSVKVAAPWVRAPAPGQTTAVAYMELTSANDAALVAAGSPLAQSVELHSMSTEGGIMRMRPLQRFELPAGKTVKLAPNGVHLMLIDLRRPLKPGEKVPLVLTVQSSGTSVTTLNIEAEVRPASGASHTH